MVRHRTIIQRKNRPRGVAAAPGAIPAVIADAGGDAINRFLQFFAAEIRNKNTRSAYLRACRRFFDWCAGNGFSLRDIEPVHVAAYVEILSDELAAPTVKQHLAAIRMLFDYLVIGQIVATNPAAAVRGPKHSVKRGKTPVLNKEELRALFDSIDTSTVVGLRDRALIGVMVYSFARVSAAVGMTVADYYVQGKRAFLRLHEKGGKFHKVPAHHTAQEYLDAYVHAAGIGDQPKTALFRASARGRNPKSLTANSLTRETALQLIKRRAQHAGLPADVCNHSFRGSGITVYLENGGTIEKAASIAGHESTRTTQLYDRSDDDVSLDEIERIHI